MTAKQKQCLLCYLGYYTGAIDGIFGPASVKATKAFQTDHGLEADGIFGEKTISTIFGALQKPAPDIWQSLRYFRKEEFRCKCGGKYCDGYPAAVDAGLLRAAEAVRAHFAAPAYVSSGLRCERHNAAVGGVAESRHKTGKAMDFCISGKAADEVLTYVQQQPDIRYAYAIDENYIHMDVS